MSDEARQEAVTMAKKELDREQVDAIEQELTNPARRTKYLKAYADELTNAVRVLISVPNFILMVTYI
jgi:hypothetical protein